MTERHDPTGQGTPTARDASGGQTQPTLAETQAEHQRRLSTGDVMAMLAPANKERIYQGAAEEAGSSFEVVARAGESFVHRSIRPIFVNGMTFYETVLATTTVGEGQIAVEIGRTQDEPAYLENHPTYISFLRALKDRLHNAT